MKERIHIIHIIQCLPCVKGEFARVGGDGNLELCVRLLLRSNRSVLQHVLENKKNGRVRKEEEKKKNTIKKYIYINCDLEALVWVFTAIYSVHHRHYTIFSASLHYLVVQSSQNTRQIIYNRSSLIGFPAPNSFK